MLPSLYSIQSVYYVHIRTTIVSNPNSFAFTTQQRQKEISIRRVLGASTTGVVMMISKNYLWLALIAAVIAFPVAWYFMNKWLQIFPYNTGLSLAPFAVSAAAILLTAVGTAGFHSAKAAWAKPAKNLRTE